jgi:hypothetical protein
MLFWWFLTSFFHCIFWHGFSLGCSSKFKAVLVRFILPMCMVCSLVYAQGYPRDETPGQISYKENSQARERKRNKPPRTKVQASKQTAQKRCATPR